MLFSPQNAISQYERLRMPTKLDLSSRHWKKNRPSFQLILNTKWFFCKCMRWHFCIDRLSPRQIYKWKCINHIEVLFAYQINKWNEKKWNGWAKEQGNLLSQAKPFSSPVAFDRAIRCAMQVAINKSSFILIRRNVGCLCAVASYGMDAHIVEYAMEWISMSNNGGRRWRRHYETQKEKSNRQRQKREDKKTNINSA